MNIQNELQFHYTSQTQREVEEKCLKSQIIKLSNYGRKEWLFLVWLSIWPRQSEVQTRVGVGEDHRAGTWSMEGAILYIPHENKQQ